MNILNKYELGKLKYLLKLLKEECKNYQTYKRIYEANNCLNSKIEVVENMLIDNPEINSLMDDFTDMIAKYLTNKGYIPEETYSLNDNEIVLYNYVSLIKSLYEIIDLHSDFILN